MISRLKGILLEADFTEVVIDVQGVGYALTVPLSTFDKLPLSGNEVTLFTYLQVREDALQLYGFASNEERALFKLLTAAVSGIGPKLALNVLSCVSIDAFTAAVADGDIKALSRINGIGKRTAERIVLELKDKLPAIKSPGNTDAKAARILPRESQEAADAVSALETLGFKHDAANNAICKVLDESGPGAAPTAEQLIRKALALLNS